jgi:hypothetical protein
VKDDDRARAGTERAQGQKRKYPERNAFVIVISQPESIETSYGKGTAAAMLRGSDAFETAT